MMEALAGVNQQRKTHKLHVIEWVGGIVNKTTRLFLLQCVQMIDVSPYVHSSSHSPAFNISPASV